MPGGQQAGHLPDQVHDDPAQVTDSAVCVTPMQAARWRRQQRRGHDGTGALAAGLVPTWLAGPAVWGAIANGDDCPVAWRQLSAVRRGLEFLRSERQGRADEVILVRDRERRMRPGAQDRSPGHRLGVGLAA